MTPTNEEFEPSALSYSKLIEVTLKYIKMKAKDNEMLARAELKQSYRISDDQINTALFREHSKSKIKQVEAKHDSVDLTKVEQLDYLMEGWIPRGDVALTYGPYGTGKTTLLIWKAYNYALGKNILDRDKPCEKGKSLIIATDSGAAALKKAMDDLGIDPDDPMFKPGHPDQMIWIKAYEPDQGLEAWMCDIHGVVELEADIEKNDISFVGIDSAKSVTSGCWSYTHNESVKALLKYLREVVCQPSGVCLEFISHDGSEKGSYSGAKAWGEDPAMVMSLTIATDEDGKERGVKALFKKDRAATIDPRRTLTYSFGEGGGLSLQEGIEVVGNCVEAVCNVLWQATINKKVPLSTQGIKDEVLATHGRSGKTVENSLRAAMSKRKITRARKGFYRLSPEEKERRASKTKTQLVPNRGVGELGGGYMRALAAQRVCPTPGQPPSGVRDPQSLSRGGTSGVSSNPVDDCPLALTPPGEGGTPQQQKHHRRDHPTLPFQCEDGEG